MGGGVEAEVEAEVEVEVEGEMQVQVRGERWAGGSGARCHSRARLERL